MAVPRASMAGDRRGIGKVAVTVAGLTGATCAAMTGQEAASNVDGIVMDRGVVRAAVPVRIRTVVPAACAASPA